jgi:hypothetical protein
LEANPDKIKWSNLSNNPMAGELLKKNIDKVDWKNNLNKFLPIEILEENKDKINWELLCYFCHDSKITDFLMQNIKEINKAYKKQNLNDYNKKIQNGLSPDNDIFYDKILENEYYMSNIMKYDYDMIKTDFYNSYGEELVKYLYHPKNIHKWSIDGLNLFD